ncbi:pilus assembly FimT family protein [Acidocella sp.]|uniref:pilus assembly FimT family protein n=1 Tax=Acidocella sp. TaxID=50710 RepID=UPI003D04E085
MPRNKADAGFTLLEMLVTIAVMGLVLAMLAGFMQPHSRRLETEIAARHVAQALRATRGQAIASGTAATFIPPRLPTWITVSLQAPPGGIVFTPDGGASGGRMLLDGVGPEIAISVDWLTGQVRIDAPP